MASVGPPKIASDWPFEVRPLTPVFGAEILGIDLDQAASPEIFPSIHAAWLRYQVLAFRGLEVPPATQVAFAANFGEVQVHVMNQYQGETDHPEAECKRTKSAHNCFGQENETADEQGRQKARQFSRELERAPAACGHVKDIVQVIVERGLEHCPGHAEQGYGSCE